MTACADCGQPALHTLEDGPEVCGYCAKRRIAAGQHLANQYKAPERLFAAPATMRGQTAMPELD